MRVQEAGLRNFLQANCSVSGPHRQPQAPARSGHTYLWGLSCGRTDSRTARVGIFVRKSRLCPHRVCFPGSQASPCARGRRGLPAEFPSSRVGPVSRSPSVTCSTQHLSLGTSCVLGAVPVATEQEERKRDPVASSGGMPLTWPSAAQCAPTACSHCSWH